MDTLQSFLDYLDVEKNYSKHTVIAYKSDVTNFIDYLNDNCNNENVETVPYSFIRSWIVSLSDSGISNRSINRKISSLNAYYSFLQKIGERKDSPLAKHRALKVEAKIQVPFSQEEINEVLNLVELNTFEDYRDKAVIELLYSTGMRRSELINLKTIDVDFRKGQIKVLGKRNKERFIPLLQNTVQTLLDYGKAKQSHFPESTPYFFVTGNNHKIYETFVYRIINKYFSKVSSKAKKSPHIIRHAFATHLLNQGASLNAVKDLLGHSSLAATQVYTHNDIAALKKAYASAHPRNSN